MKSFLKIGLLSSEEIVEKIFKLSIIAFFLHLLDFIIGKYYYLLFVTDENGIICNNDLQIIVSKTFFWIKTISIPIIGLLFIRLLCEIAYKILKAAEKYLNTNE